MEDKTIVALCGLLCVTVLEALNLAYIGVDGAILSTVVGAILFIVGLMFGVRVKTDLLKGSSSSDESGSET